MKICFFSGDITRPGGTEKVCIRIASALAAKGYDVTILSAARGRAEPFFPIPGSVTLVSLGETFPKPGPGWLRIRFRLDRFLRRQRFDFLVDVDGVLDLIALGPARRAGTRLISWEHFGFEEQFGRGYRRLAGRAARRAFAVVALTESGAAEYEKRLKAAGKVVCIPNPAPCPDMGESGAEQKEKLILSVGRLCAQKGFDMLADCAALVLKTHGDWRWSVVGEGGGRAALEKRTRELGLEGRLTFPGADRNMAAWYARSSIFVMTSRFEGLPVALMEAMAYGLPAVAFDVPTGPGELLTGRRGCALVPPFDVEKMAAAVCRAIDAFPAEAEKGLPGLYAETAVTEAWERLFRAASSGQGNR